MDYSLLIPCSSSQALGARLREWESVAMTTGVADAEELFLDGRAVVKIVFYLHVVAGAKPAVGVAVSCTPGLWSCQCDVIVAQRIPKIGVLSQRTDCQRIQFIERPIKNGAAPMSRKS